MQASATGQQHELRSGQHVAVVVETGGGLRRYAYAGREVVDGYPADALPDAARGQLLVPWPNRVRDGRYRWDGVDQQLALTEPGACNAIHGLVRTLPFAVRARDDATVTLGATLLPQRGYPHRLDVAVTYALAADGLAVTVSARNTGETDAPYAVGQHPYISVGTADAKAITRPQRTPVPALATPPHLKISAMNSAVMIGISGPNGMRLWPTASISALVSPLIAIHVSSGTSIP